jgi:hypothetical protein
VELSVISKSILKPAAVILKSNDEQLQHELEQFLATDASEKHAAVANSK